MSRNLAGLTLAPASLPSGNALQLPQLWEPRSTLGCTAGGGARWPSPLQPSWANLGKYQPVSPCGHHSPNISASRCRGFLKELCTLSIKSSFHRSAQVTEGSLAQV